MSHLLRDNLVCKVYTIMLNEHSCKMKVLFFFYLILSLHSFLVDSVPTVVLLKNRAQVDRIDGADAAEVTAKVRSQIANNSINAPLPLHYKQLISRHAIMVFMKGDRITPKCGFSRTLIQILNGTGLEYETFDILSDEEVRKGLKTYSEWPNYPQVYVKGKLVGGLDIIKELELSGELKSSLKG